MLEGEHVRAAISRAYYAAFQAARAALLAKGEAPKTHAGVADRFYVRFVRAGRIPEAIGSTLLRALQERQGADYDPLSVFDVGGARDLLNDVGAFVGAVTGLIGASGPPPVAD